MTATPSRRILRYRPAQRFVHWMGAAGFLLMLLSGTALLWSPLSSLAAGGLTRMMHRVGVLLYILWPILYMILDPAAFRETIKESITFTRDDLQWFKHMWQYFLRQDARSTAARSCQCRSKAAPHRRCAAISHRGRLWSDPVVRRGDDGGQRSFCSGDGSRPVHVGTDTAPGWTSVLHICLRRTQRNDHRLRQ